MSLGRGPEKDETTPLKKGAAFVAQAIGRVFLSPAHYIFYSSTWALMIALLCGLDIPGQFYALWAFMGFICFFNYLGNTKE